MSIGSCRRWALARLHLSCPLSFTAFASSPHVALALNMLQRSAHNSRVSLTRGSVCRFIATGCVPLSGSRSSSSFILFSPILYLALLHFHSTMESGLLLFKARVGGYPVLFAWGLTLDLYQSNHKMLQVYLCQVRIPSVPVPRSVPCCYSCCISSTTLASLLMQNPPSSE